jgi:hypothetical protein
VNQDESPGPRPGLHSDLWHDEPLQVDSFAGFSGTTDGLPGAVGAGMTESWSGGQGDSSRRDLTVNRAPVWILGLSAVLSIAAALATWLSGNVAVAFTSWVFAGPVGTGVLALFQNRDAHAQSDGAYARDYWATPAFVASVFVCLAAVILCAFRIAMWVGRL